MYLSEIERRAWDSRENSTQHKPEVALKAALDDMAKSPGTIQAVVVIVRRDAEGDLMVESYQAGEYDRYGIIGALDGAKANFLR